VKEKNIPLDERIIFALDVDSHEAAQKWVERLETHVRFTRWGSNFFSPDGFAPSTGLFSGGTR